MNTATNTQVTPLPDQSFELKEKVAALQAALLSAHPTMPVLLRTIHTQLRNDPELVTALSEEEIGQLVNCLKVQTRTEIVTTASKPASASSLKKQLKSAGGSSADMF